MSSFSASDAALSGFRFIGRRPKTVAIWAAVFLAYELAWGGLVVGLAGDQLPALKALSRANGQDQAAAWSMLPGVSLIFLFGLLALLLLGALLFTAAYRAFLHPEDDRYGYIRLGSEELRFAALIVLWVALSIGASFVIAFVSGLLAALGSVLPQPLQLIYLVIVGAGVACAFVYPLVRLSFSMPMTMVDRHIRFLESWKLTRGRFWPLLAAYLLAALLIGVLLIVVWSIVAVVAAIVAVAAGLQLSDLSGLFRTDTSSLASYFSPTSLIAAVLNAFASGAALAIFTAPVAQGYLSVVSDHEDEAARSEP